MVWNVFVDLARPLNDAERRDVFGAVDAIIPDSGCVGPNRSGVDEIYFNVEADNEGDARARATALLVRVLAHAALTTDYEVTVQPRR